MTFTNGLLILATIIYCLIGGDQVLKHNIGMGIAYLAYAVANAAMILMSK